MQDSEQYRKSNVCSEAQFSILEYVYICTGTWCQNVDTFMIMTKLSLYIVKYFSVASSYLCYAIQ